MPGAHRFGNPRGRALELVVMRILVLKLLLSSCAILIGALSCAAQNKFPYNEYDPRTVAELVQNGTAAIPPNLTTKYMMLDAKPFYSAIRLKYVGTSRPVPPEKKEVFKMWQESMRPNADITALIDNEYLFRECDAEYWIPVQKQVAAYFPKELKSGDLITVYLMVIGGVRLAPKDSYQPVFMVNEFRKYE